MITMKRWLLSALLTFAALAGFAQTITVTSPNGGESWNSCTVHAITWTQASTSGFFNVDYSTNGGSTWASIATFLNATNLSWTVPNVQSGQCLVRVYDSYAPATVDQSNAVFTINAAIQVITPNGGENWQVANPATRQITWVATGTGTYVTIEYSIDAGSNWTTITTSALASSGSYTWTIPNNPSSQCLVRVKDNLTPCMADVSNNLFTIVAPTPVITVTSPNTAVQWYVGSTYNIQWTSSYVTNPFVGIDYSIDGGSTWLVIVNSTNNTGSYSWNIPNNPSTQCRVRVRDASQPSTFDISNINFTILVPVPVITVSAPNGGENWNSCTTVNITWSSVFTSGSFKLEYSTNNGGTWNTIANGVGGSSYSWTVPNNIPTSSQCLIRVSDQSTPATFDISNATFTINQVAYVVVTSPNGGENWQVGSPSSQLITWVYNGTSTSFRIDYSTDNGATWINIVNGLTAPSSPASYNWTIPNTPSNQCLVRVMDYNNNCRADQSDNVFSITPPTPVFTVTNPNTATTFYVGSTYSINWTSQYVTDPFVGIDYSIDGGTTWIVITNTSNNNGAYSWNVPNTPSTTCRVRVRAASSPSIFDISNVNFTIATPVSSISVSTPNGGENWSSCVNQTISWSSSNVTGNYKVEYSADGGATWTQITITSTTSYSWQVPNNVPTSTQCLIRVSSVNNPAITDNSNNTFTITHVEYIVVTSPIGSEQWQVGNPASRPITWVYNGTTTQFLIDYSVNNGASWTSVINYTTASSSPASYSWTIPNDPSTQALVRVSDRNATCKMDQSDSVFAIQSPTPVITVTNPNTAVTWYVGSQYTINWTSQYVTDPFVSIDYSTDGGTTWTSVIGAINTSAGSYNWTVPNTPSPNCRVRVKSTANPSTIYDISNVNFTIATPVPSITLSSPNGGENWSSCTNQTIYWSSAFTSGTTRVEFSTDNGATWTIIGNSGSSSLAWQVPNNVATSTQCLIRVSDYSNPAVNDVSNAVFTITHIDYIVVTSPNGGEQWEVGNPASRPITWVYNGTTTQFLIDYSVNNGASWTSVINYTTASSSPASYSWTIPNDPSAQALVRVSDRNATCKMDQSNTVFEIQSPIPVITVTNPNTATTWYVGSQYTINWTNQYVTDPFVSIDYSTDGGATWSAVLSSINTSVGSYNWTVPNTPSPACRVRVKSTANPSTIYDISNVNFTIATPVPSITLSSPNGAENWSSCTSQTIYWSSAFTSGTTRVEFSTDNGLTWTIIGNSGSNSLAWQVPNNVPTSTQCLIRVSDYSNPAVNDVSNAVFTITHIDYIVVTSPNGGEQWEVGNPSSRPITWVYNGTTTQFIIDYSVNNGASWTSVINYTTASSSPASYSWTIPNDPSAQALVRVSDRNATCKMDQSNTVFAIQPPTPVITVTNPNTAVTWYVGSQYTINWTNQYVTDPFVSIDYSTDGGTTWSSVLSSINTSVGSYNWTVPNTPSPNCRVRVKSTANPSTVFDISNVNFTIATPVPSITLSSPNGGENWSSCTSQTIYWSSAFTSGTTLIEVSSNNGATWTAIGTSGTNSFVWQVANNIPTSTQCLIRVSDYSNPVVNDVSNTVFTITHVDYIVVTSPDGGEQWQVANPNSQLITWVYSGTTTQFLIDYSNNNGASWNSIINYTTASSSPASYSWTIPNDPGTQSLVRVTDRNATCKTDQSNNVFAIVPPTPNITVTSPNTNVTWGVGGNYNINWTSSYVTDPYVAIDYSTDGGTTWTNIVNSINTSVGSYNWTVPNTLSSQCRVRVRAASNPAIFDISNVNFTIAPAITVTSPNGGENWGGCTVTSVTWTAYGCSNNYKIEYSLDNGGTWNVVTSSYSTAATNCTYSWTVPHNSSSTSLVRVSDASAPAKVDIGDNNFTIFPAITVTYPNTNVSVFSTQSVNITWTSTGVSNYYSIDYSTNGGSTWTNIIFNTLILTNSYTWTVPGTLSSNCLIRVTDYQNTCKQDRSDNAFSISSPSAFIAVTAPNGGESISACSIQNILWSATGTSNTYTIDYSTNGGTNWTNIVTNYANPGPNCSYAWTVPNSISANCLVRVVDFANATRVDQSNAIFSISSFTIAASAASPTICAGSSTVLTASGAASYVWLPAGSLSSSTSATPTATPSGSTTYTVTGTQGTCSATANISLTVVPLPTVTASGAPTSLCAGSSTNLNASGATTYSWLPGGSLNLTNIPNPVATPPTTTTYTVTGTSAGCSSNATLTITVNTAPSITTSATPPTICASGTTTLSATGATSYTWNPGNLSGSSVTVSPTTTTTYTVNGTIGGCSTTQPITVNVNAIPNVAIAGASGICAGGTTTLSASGATTYNWQPGNLTGNSIVVSPSSSTTYTVTGTNGGCTNTATFTVAVSPPPTVAAAGGGNICSGSNTTLTASGATTYAWQPGNLSGGSITVNPTATTTYTVTGTTSGCSATSTVTVSVTPQPVITVAGNTTICTGNSTTLTASGGTTYTWMPGNLTGSSITISPVSTTTYTVTGTTNGCTGTNTVTVNVGPPPTVAASATQGTICNGNNTTLSATGATTYTWMPGNLSGATVGLSPIATTTYTVTGTIAGGCSATSTVTIIVNPSPTVTTSGTTSICSGSSTTLTASGAVSYLWQPGNLTGSSITVTPSSNTTYTVSGTTSGCSGTSTIAVSVTAPPSVSVTGTSNICAGSNSTLSASGATTYSWMPGSLTGTSVTVTPSSSTTYTVTGTTNGCANTATFALTVSPAPTVGASASQSSVCTGGSSILTATGATTYTWMPGNITGSSTTVNPVGTTTYTVTGVGAGGCSSTSTVTVTVNPTPTVVITGTTGVCTGGSTTLTSSGAATYNWMPGNLSGNNQTLAPSANTTYTVTGTTLGCTSTSTVTITVSPTPTLSITGNTTICSGNPTTLAVNGASTYSWQPGNITGSSVTVSPVATTTYTVTGTTGGCSVTSTITVTVGTTPTLTSTATPGTICAGSTSSLSASGATTYNWMPGNISGSTATVTPSASTTYTVTGTSATGCSSTSTVTVLVNSVPTVSTSGTTNICSGNSTSLSASGAVSYNWMPGNLTTSTVALTPAATTTYTVTGTTNGCTGTTLVTVNVNPAPNVVASGTAAICSGTSTTIAASGAVTYNWLPGNMTGSSITVTPAATTTYTVTGTSGSGCAATASVTITVNPSPVVTASGTGPVCAGGSATLTSTGATTYNWMPGNLSGSSVTVTPSATTTYTVTGTAATCSSTSTVTVTVNPAPTVTLSGNTTVCSGNSTTLSATGAATYNWMPGNLSGNSVTITPASTTTYTVTGTTGGCTAVQNITVTVETTPIVIASSAPGTICAGNSATLTGSGTTTYSWMPGNLTGSSVSVAPSVSTTYTLTGTSVTGCSATSTVTVLVNAVPVVATSGATNICSGSSTTLSASGAISYNWMPGNLSGSSVTLTPSSPTTYTVTGTTNGCSGTTQVLVNVTPPPTVTATGFATICSGNSTTIAASGAVSYNWLPGNLNGSSVTVSPATTTSYTVTGTTNGCSDTSLVTITVNPSPAITASATQTILCSGGSSTLTVNGATSYNWMPGNLTGSSITVTPALSTTYTVTGTNGSCSSTATVAITVQPGLTATAGSDATICPGGNTQLNATGGTFYTWTPSAGLSSSTIANPVASPALTTTYVVTVSNGSCAANDTVVVVVAPPVTLTATASSATICNGDPATLTATGAATYNWMPGNLNGASVTVAPTSNTTYTVTGTSVNGCTNSATVSISVNPAPNVSSAATQNSICVGDNTTLLASGATTYNWMPGNLSGSSVTLSPVATTTYTVTGSNGAGCSATSTITITVNAYPVVNATAAANNICAGTQTLLTGTGASTYNWMPGNLSGSNVTVTPTVNTTYTVIGSNGVCSDTTSITVTVIASPTVTITSTDSSLCAGGSATLTAGGAIAYTWQPGNINAGSITVTPASSTTYTVTGISLNGCSDTATLEITVSPYPVMTSTASSSTICLGDATTLAAGGATTYNWMPGNLSGSNVSVSPTANTTYTVTGMNAAGCSGTSSVTITVNPLPTVFLVMPYDTVCDVSAVIQLTGGSPAGGFYSGPGVNGTTFDPGAAGAGLATITYSYTEITTGCTNTATHNIYVDVCSGIDPVVTQDATLNLFPNPTVGNVTLVLSDATDKTLVEMYNNLGEIVGAWMMKSDRLEIDMSVFPVGVYHVMVTNGNEVLNANLIKQ